MSTLTADQMRIDAEKSINQSFTQADQHAQRYNQAGVRANGLTNTRDELQAQLGRPLTLVYLIISYVISIAVFGAFVLTESLINRDTLASMFGKMATSQWESLVAIFAGASIALVNIYAGHKFFKTITTAEVNPVTGKHMYDKKGLILPILYILTYILFQQFLIRTAGGGKGQFIPVQLMSLFLAILEFGSAYLLLKPMTAIMLGITNTQIRRANRVLTRERAMASDAYTDYISSRERYNELYPQSTLPLRHSNFIDVCLELQGQPQTPQSQPQAETERVGNDEIENAVDSILGDDDDDNNTNPEESPVDYQLRINH